MPRSSRPSRPCRLEALARTVPSLPHQRKRTRRRPASSSARSTTSLGSHGQSVAEQAVGARESCTAKRFKAALGARAAALGATARQFRRRSCRRPTRRRARSPHVGSTGSIVRRPAKRRNPWSCDARTSPCSIGERRELDVRRIVAPQPRRGGELGGDVGVPRARRDDPDRRLRQVRRAAVAHPRLAERALAPKTRGPRDQPDEGVDDGPAESSGFGTVTSHTSVSSSGGIAGNVAHVAPAGTEMAVRIGVFCHARRPPRRTPIPDPRPRGATRARAQTRSAAPDASSALLSGEPPRSVSSVSRPRWAAAVSDSAASGRSRRRARPAARSLVSFQRRSTAATRRVSCPLRGCNRGAPSADAGPFALQAVERITGAVAPATLSFCGFWRIGDEEVLDAGCSEPPPMSIPSGRGRPRSAHRSSCGAVRRRKRPTAVAREGRVRPAHLPRIR